MVSACAPLICIKEVLLRETFANWVQRPADTASHDFSASDYTPKAFTFILDTRVRAHNGEIPNMDSAVEEFTACKLTASPT